MFVVCLKNYTRRTCCCSVLTQLPCRLKRSQCSATADTGLWDSRAGPCPPSCSTPNLQPTWTQVVIKGRRERRHHSTSTLALNLSNLFVFSTDAPVDPTVAPPSAACDDPCLSSAAIATGSIILSGTWDAAAGSATPSAGATTTITEVMDYANRMSRASFPGCGPQAQWAKNLVQLCAPALQMALAGMLLHSPPDAGKAPRYSDYHRLCWNSTHPKSGTSAANHWNVDANPPPSTGTWWMLNCTTEVLPGSSPDVDLPGSQQCTHHCGKSRVVNHPAPIASTESLSLLTGSDLVW